MATANTANFHGFEDGKWYKFRSVGDNNVIQLESPTGSKLICMPENSDLNDIQLFRATSLPNGKYHVVAKCQKSVGVCQAWDYLFHRDLLIVKKEVADALTQTWASEHVPGYNSLYLIQSSPVPDSYKCIKNMGQGKQIKLISKSNECFADVFTRWYLELQVDIGSITAPALVATLPTPLAPVVTTASIPAPAVPSIANPATPVPSIANPAPPVASIVNPAPIPAPSAGPVFEGFKDGTWYKLRSAGDNNVIQILETTEGKRLTCMPEHNDLVDMQRFQVTLLPNGKFSIRTGARSLPIPHVWDYISQEEQLMLNLTIQSEIDKFSQNWAPISIPGHELQCSIQPNSSPEAPESDSHKCIKNMGQGNPIQLVNQSTEGVGDSYTRWILEPQVNMCESTTSATTPCTMSFSDVVVALQAKEASNVERMDTA